MQIFRLIDRRKVTRKLKVSDQHKYKILGVYLTVSRSVTKSCDTMISEYLLRIVPNFRAFIRLKYRLSSYMKQSPDKLEKKLKKSQKV